MKQQIVKALVEIASKLKRIAFWLEEIAKGWDLISNKSGDKK